MMETLVSKKRPHIVQPHKHGLGDIEAFRPCRAEDILDILEQEETLEKQELVSKEEKTVPARHSSTSNSCDRAMSAFMIWAERRLPDRDRPWFIVLGARQVQRKDAVAVFGLDILGINFDRERDGTIETARQPLTAMQTGIFTVLNSFPTSDADRVMSNTGMTCNGHNTGANNGDAHTTNNGCGITQNSNAPIMTDPYKSLASNIPADTCGGSYPQEPKNGTYSGHKNCTGNFPTSGPVTLPASTIVGGDVQLTGDVTVTSSPGLAGSVLVIENGQLDTNGHTLLTAPGSALTIIFSGSSGSYTHAPTGSGTLNFCPHLGNMVRHRDLSGPRADHGSQHISRGHHAHLGHFRARIPPSL